MDKNLLREFIKFCIIKLDLNQVPKLTLIHNPDFSKEMKSFGGYIPDEKKITLSTHNRHQADIFRTLAHEMVHFKQDLEGRITESSGETGSVEENEANSTAGIIMREFAQSNPQLFE